MSCLLLQSLTDFMSITADHIQNILLDEEHIASATINNLSMSYNIHHHDDDRWRKGNYAELNFVLIYLRIQSLMDLPILENLQQGGIII
jgi:hypothetical protein